MSCTLPPSNKSRLSPSFAVHMPVSPLCADAGATALRPTYAAVHGTSDPIPLTSRDDRFRRSSRSARARTVSKSPEEPFKDPFRPSLRGYVSPYSQRVLSRVGRDQNAPPRLQMQLELQAEAQERRRRRLERERVEREWEELKECTFKPDLRASSAPGPCRRARTCLQRLSERPQHVSVTYESQQLRGGVSGPSRDTLLYPAYTSHQHQRLKELARERLDAPRRQEELARKRERERLSRQVLRNMSAPARLYCAQNVFQRLLDGFPSSGAARGSSRLRKRRLERQAALLAQARRELRSKLATRLGIRYEAPWPPNEPSKASSPASLAVGTREQLTRLIRDDVLARLLRSPRPPSRPTSRPLKERLRDQLRAERRRSVEVLEDDERRARVTYSNTVPLPPLQPFRPLTSDALTYSDLLPSSSKPLKAGNASRSYGHPRIVASDLDEVVRAPLAGQDFVPTETETEGTPEVFRTGEEGEEALGRTLEKQAEARLLAKRRQGGESGGSQREDFVEAFEKGLRRRNLVKREVLRMLRRGEEGSLMERIMAGQEKPTLDECETKTLETMAQRQNTARILYSGPILVSDVADTGKREGGWDD
ncbi:hypothetical protein GMRT_16390 [Giardia muris]|uniref:Uncharacterized protein n=1 Tax=Giardia muris TaxID=5742 RepID=A0A4Z1T2D2_GIAMU|nr:hypothetical protein GMRT_16390 [Giardia muris]|eukprot:TNJ26571.1 hypothetical protein GMRT_16390 [Giardia muris]